MYSVRKKKRAVVKNRSGTLSIFPGRPEMGRGASLAVIRATCQGPHIPPVQDVSIAHISEQKPSKLSSKKTNFTFSENGA
jgi:hypothetical protein